MIIGALQISKKKSQNGFFYGYTLCNDQIGIFKFPSCKMAIFEEISNVVIIGALQISK